MRSTYVPGTSWLHAVPAGGKLAGLAVLMLPVVLFRSTVVLAVFAGVTAVLYRSAGFSWQQLWEQVRPLRWMIVLLIGAHALLGGGSAESWRSGVVVAGTIAVAVALAALLTLTTPVSEMIETVQRALGPFQRFGVNPEKIALLLALTIRAIPVIATLASEVRDAQRARGVSHSVRAFAVPLVVRSVRHADALGEALIARGLDDPPPPPSSST